MVSDAPGASTARGWRRQWRARPPQCSRPLWAVVLLLNRLPWPWGEDLLAWMFVGVACLRLDRLRRALRWAGARTPGPWARWRLALRLCAHYGRVVARLMLVGFRDPDHLRAHVVLRGEEHVAAGSGRGVIFLGFHLGPPGSALALRLAGHRLTWARGWGDAQPGIGEAWRRFHAEGEALFLPPGRRHLGGALYEARRLLLEGRTIYITADSSGRGKEAFRLPIAPTPVVVRAGGLTLARHTGAIVFPVLSHLDGHTQIVTIHPALPSLGPDPGGGMEACREALQRIVEPFVREHPEQCYSLVFERRRRGRSRSADAAGAALAAGKGAGAPRA